MLRTAGLVVLFALGGGARAAEFHATTDITVMYDAPSAKQAWERTMMFLGKHL